MRMKQFRYRVSNAAGYLVEDDDGKCFVNDDRYMRYSASRNEQGLSVEQQMLDALNEMRHSACVKRLCCEFIERVADVISVSVSQYTVSVNSDGSYTVMECVTVVYKEGRR